MRAPHDWVQAPSSRVEGRRTHDTVSMTVPFRMDSVAKPDLHWDLALAATRLSIYASGS